MLSPIFSRGKIFVADGTTKDFFIWMIALGVSVQFCKRLEVPRASLTRATVFTQVGFFHVRSALTPQKPFLTNAAQEPLSRLFTQTFPRVLFSSQAYLLVNFFEVFPAMLCHTKCFVAHRAAKDVFIWMVRLGVGIQTSIILEFL